MDKMDRRKILFFILFIVTIIFSIIIRTPMSIMPFIFLVGVGILSLIYICFLYLSYDMKIIGDKIKSYERLDISKYKIIIKNKSILIFPYISFTISLTNDEGHLVEKFKYDFILGPKEEKEIIMDLEFPHIGKYYINVEKVYIFGILGLIPFKLKYDYRESVKVKPKKYNILSNSKKIDTFDPIFNVERELPYKIDGEEFEDVREYEYGDSMKNIHWKLSAHTDKYMTRVMTTDGISGITVYMDFMGNENLKFKELAILTDILVESAFAMGLYTLKEDYEISYIYSQEKLPRCESPKNYSELSLLMESFPRVSKKQEYPLELLLIEYTKTIVSFDNIIILTNNLDKNLIISINNLIKNNYYPIIFYINYNIDKKLNSKIKKELEQNNIEWYQINSAREFSEIIGGRV